MGYRNSLQTIGGKVKEGNINPSFGKNYNAYFGSIRWQKLKAQNQFLQRNFFLDKALSQTDVWRAKSEGKNLICDFDFEFDLDNIHF